MTDTTPQPPYKPQVWLIKAPPTGLEERYTAELESAGYEARYIPAIVELFDTAELEEVLLDAEEGTWDGVVITSKRGSEGWVRAARAVHARSEEPIKFSHIPLYTVGTTSIDTLAEAEISHHLLPNIFEATSAKSAQALAEIMLVTLPPPVTGQTRPSQFLFIRGDKSANDLQPRLREAGHTVQEVQVYTTSAHPGLADLIEKEIGGLSGAGTSEQTRDVWLAFFSPSTAGYALPHVQSLLRGGGSPEGVRVKTAAIGEKTRAFLEESGLKVDAVPDEPNAASLVKALQAAS